MVTGEQSAVPSASDGLKDEVMEEPMVSVFQGLQDATKEEVLVKKQDDDDADFPDKIKDEPMPEDVVSGSSSETDHDDEWGPGVGIRFSPYLTTFDRLDLCIKSLRLVEVGLSQTIVGGRNFMGHRRLAQMHR